MKNRNEICSNCGKKMKNCSCVKKVSYKKIFLTTLTLLFVLIFYFSIEGKWNLNNERPKNVSKTGERKEYFNSPEEAYESLINFISDKSNGTYMVLLLKDKSKLNLSIAVNHGTHKDATHNNASQQLKKISWWFNQIKGNKLFLIEQAGLANANEYSLEQVSNKAYYEKILTSDFLVDISDSRIRECDVRKNLFHEVDGNFFSMIDYGKIAKKAGYNVRNIIFDLEPGDYSLPVDELFSKIISPDYNIGFQKDRVSKEDLYESLLFEQSSVLFEEECVKYMDEHKNVFSITGAMHAPYICENILFVASSAEELGAIIQVTNRHFIMRNLLNKISHDNTRCFEYEKICNYLREIYGTNIPINYKNAY